MKYLVQKQGFKDSAAIFDTVEQANHDATRFYPDVPYEIIPISDDETTLRMAKYHKRLLKMGITP
jgi:hypothetical protein